MSCYSGKSDLFDHIKCCSGKRDKDGNKVDDTYFGPTYGDEWEDFLVFKKKTKGLLHQHKKVLVTEMNREDVQKRCPRFKIHKHSEIIQDKRYKDGTKERVYYTYEYCGKEYKTLKELNKEGVNITIDIPFDTLLDLIPYYPYLSWGDGSFISDKPYPIMKRDESLEKGGRAFASSECAYYQSLLQDHYREVVLKYYNPEGREVVEELNFEKAEAGDYVATTSFNVSPHFNISWVFDKEPICHWSGPYRLPQLGNNKIGMSESDATYFLGTKMKVRYVKDIEESK